MNLLQLVTMLLLLAGQPTRDPHWGAVPVADALSQVELGLPPELLLAVALHESRFNPRAVGKVGETGLWQVHPVHRDPDYHLQCGVFPEDCAMWHASKAAALLRKGLAVCGDLRGALAHYNRGHGCKGRGAYVAGVLRELRYVEELKGK